MGAPINARMGLNTWAAFIGTNDKAAIAGDVAMLDSEVTPVLKALRKNGLDVVAIHHHMTGHGRRLSFCTTGAPDLPTHSRRDSKRRSASWEDTAAPRLDDSAERRGRRTLAGPALVMILTAPTATMSARKRHHRFVPQR